MSCSERREIREGESESMREMNDWKSKIEEGLYADNNNQWQRDSAQRYSFTLQIISHMYGSTLIFSSVEHSECVCFHSPHSFFFGFPWFSLQFIEPLYLFRIHFSMQCTSWVYVLDVSLCVCIEIQTYGQCILSITVHTFMHRMIFFNVCPLRLWLYKSGIMVEMERESGSLAWLRIW